MAARLVALLPTLLALLASACARDPAPAPDPDRSRPALESNSADGDADNVLRQAAEQARESGDVQAEIETLRELTARLPDDAALHFRLGTLLIDGQLPAAAVPHLRRVIEIRGKDRPASMALVYALQMHGRFDDAAAELERMKAWAASPEPHVRLGWLHLHRGRLDAARTEFEAALDRWPVDSGARIGLGALLREQGELEPSRAILEEAAQLPNSSAQVHYQLGLTYRALGDSVKARQAMARYERSGGGPAVPRWSRGGE